MKLGGCYKYNEDQHAYEIESTEDKLWVVFDPLIAEVISDPGVVKKTYNIKVTLQEVDGIERPDWQQRVIDEEREAGRAA